LARSLGRSADPSRAQSYGTKHLREACAAAAEAVREEQAVAGERSVAAGGPDRGEGGLRTRLAEIAGEALRRSRSMLEAEAEGGVGKETAAVRRRLAMYSVVSGQWSPEAWLSEYERVLAREDGEGAAALERVIPVALEEAAASAARRGRLRSAGVGSLAEPGPSRERVRALRRRFDSLRMGRGTADGGAGRRRLAAETGRFERFFSGLLG
jgi:hypothetical protein